MRVSGLFIPVHRKRRRHQQRLNRLSIDVRVVKNVGSYSLIQKKFFRGKFRESLRVFFITQAKFLVDCDSKKFIVQGCTVHALHEFSS